MEGYFTRQQIANFAKIGICKTEFVCTNKSLGFPKPKIINRKFYYKQSEVKNWLKKNNVHAIHLTFKSKSEKQIENGDVDSDRFNRYAIQFITGKPRAKLTDKKRNTIVVQTKEESIFSPIIGDIKTISDRRQSANYSLSLPNS